ncbi:TetR family transcriptional regulator [Williamsia limnetica]|jgi:AcrR family transcriptional regulator|uniref:TetR family transcriptional regulator n=1 Tax=Williamsia limnetica TaxID=882452 RepID=A0A318RSW2_WILLI|nr:TetR family transcriptional regulator [Williamsia limnetica]PYE19157.1 TetR family transcriptional regulator [Williamsia limnetica]
MARISVERRRDLLVQAAFRVIADHGVEAATTRRISAEAEMSLASFHYAFASRDELLAELVARGTSDEFATITAPLTPPVAEPGGSSTSSDGSWTLPDDIGVLLKAGLMSYLDSVIADPGREAAMITLAQYARRTEGLEHFARRLYERYYEIAQASLEAAAAAMDLSWATDPKDLAPLVVAATDGLTLAYLNTGDREIAERIIDSTVAMLRGHVAAR